MYGKIFTLILAVFGFCLTSYSQVDLGTGTGWGNLFPSEPLVVDDNFQSYDFFHSDDVPDAGNSNNSIDPATQEIIMGYTNRKWDVRYIGAQASQAHFDCYQCAFAPEWPTAYAYKNATDNTPNVSDGFVEISRTYGSEPGEIQGYFIVDLRELDYVEIVQYTHSSCGGTKRGVLLEYSIDDSLTWDTLRMQLSDGRTGSFYTSDITGPTRMESFYNCQESAYGMVWEDGLWASNVMLRFGISPNQVPRIHDLKVYGTVLDPGNPSSADDLGINGLKIHSYDRFIRISEPANVKIYNIAGALVRAVENSHTVSTVDLNDGVYIVKAQAGNKLKTTKVFVR